jgi:tRNA pseudouridine38-40 synthase
MNRHTYRMTIAYDGTRFAGYQQQPGQRTVEGVLVNGMASIVPDFKRFTCGGRTDRGVHALAQVVSFYTRTPIDPRAVQNVVDTIAPDEIVCRDMREVPRWFHARFSAVARRYVYLLSDGGENDVAALDALVRALEGRRCFSAFARDTPAGASTVRHMLRACARRDAADLVRFEFVANGFLRRQVRVMVATALREASQDAPNDSLVQLAAQGDRRGTERPAAPGALYLAGIDYAPPQKEKLKPATNPNG